MLLLRDALHLHQHHQLRCLQLLQQLICPKSYTASKARPLVSQWGNNVPTLWAFFLLCKKDDVILIPSHWLRLSRRHQTHVEVHSAHSHIQHYNQLHFSTFDFDILLTPHPLKSLSFYGNPQTLFTKRAIKKTKLSHMNTSKFVCFGKVMWLMYFFILIYTLTS